MRDGRLVLDRSNWPEGEVRFHAEVGQEEKRRELAQGLGVPVEAVPDHLISGEGSGSRNPGPLFDEIMRAGGGRSDRAGGRGGGPRVRRHAEGSDLAASMEVDSQAGWFALRLVEQTGRLRLLEVEEEPGGGVSIRLEDPGVGLSLFLSSGADGRVTLIGRSGEMTCALSEPDFSALLRASPDEVSTHLLRPLAEAGISLAPDRCMPEVVAAATSGFGAPPPTIAREVDACIARLSDDEASVREDASRALVALYPRAIRHVRDAAERSTDPESRDRLRAVIDARPDIGTALDYVKAAGLHEDRAYLLEILDRVPSYRASARARLAELYGTDHGDDPSAWPAPK